jgi:hypothetical protein
MQDLEDYWKQTSLVTMGDTADCWEQNCQSKQREYKELCENLPPKECELELTCRQAFALLAAFFSARIARG